MHMSHVDVCVHLHAKTSSTASLGQACTSSGAFAALCADGRVVTWGDQGFGGDSSQAGCLNVLRRVADVRNFEIDLPFWPEPSKYPNKEP